MSVKSVLNGKYFKATGLYAFGSVFDKAISLLLLPVFTRLLTTESYGFVSTYNSICQIALVIVSVQLFSSIRTACVDYKEKLNEYVSAINSLIIFCFFFVSIFSLLINHFTKTVPVLLVVFCLIQSLMSAFINVEMQKNMMLLEYLKRTILLSLPNFIAAALGIVVLLLKPSLEYYGRIVPLVIVYSMFGIFLLIRNYFKGRVFFNAQMWKYALVFSVPLVMHGLANTVLSTVDRTMLTAMRNASETGVYSVAYTMGMALLVITSSLESVWIPWFTKKMNDGAKKEINTVASKYLYIVSFFCILAMLCLPEILKLFSERSYWHGVYLIPPVVLSSYTIFLYSLSVNLEYYKKATKRIAINTIIAAGLNLVLNFIFIPKYGAYAAAYTTVASYFVSFILHYFYARSLESSLFSWKMYIGPIFMVFLGAIIAYFVMDDWIVRWILSAFLFFLAIFLIKKYILNKKKERTDENSSCDAP